MLSSTGWKGLAQKMHPLLVSDDSLQECNRSGDPECREHNNDKYGPFNPSL